MARVVIEPYDARWPAAFEMERCVLDEVLSPWLVAAIEHIGSTAVPGLAAKPVIDIMAPVESLDASAGAIRAAESAGYRYFPYRADVMHWFCKPSDEVRTHHLHLVPYLSELWNERLSFRDALRSDPEVDDRDGYTDAKTTFIRGALG